MYNNKKKPYESNIFFHLQGYQSNCIILNKIKVLNKSKVFFLF